MSIATEIRPAATPVPRGQHHRRLARLGDQERIRRQFMVAMGTFAMLVILAGLLAIFDYHLELSIAARVGGWLAVFVVIATVVWYLRGWSAFRSRDAVGATERAYPEMGQRLRTSHDYTATPDLVAPANPQLLSALEGETERRVIERVREPLGRPWPAVGLAAAIALAGIVWLTALIAIPEWRVSTARLALLPIEYSSVNVEPLPEYVDQGDDLVVEARVDGRPVDTAQVLVRSDAGSPWEPIDLQPMTSKNSVDLVNDLRAVLPDRQNDFELQLEVGNYRSGIHPIDVRVPLILEEWTAVVQPPAYTGLPSSEGPPDGLRIPEGSTVTMSARYNRVPEQAEVNGFSEDTEPIATEIDQAEIRFSFVASSPAVDLTLNALAADGVKDESVLHLDVIADQPPRIGFSTPEVQSEAIPTAELRFVLEAVDDYSVSEVGIRYRIDDGEEQTLLELSDVGEPAFADNVTLPLESLGLQYPQAITYYAYAIDNRPDRDQEWTSQLQFLDIRPFSREYEFQESNCNCQGECLSLEKLIKEQREILGRTFVLARRSEIADGSGGKLAVEENELLEKTDSLTRALEEKVGPMPSLDRAIRAMAAAVEDLEDEQIREGQKDEETALAGLIAARENLRKILKLNNSQSKMCRNVDQQQLDKIRKPERKESEQKEQKEEQLARLRERLEELSRKQESFCESAKACSQSASSSAASSSPKERNPNEEGSSESNSKGASESESQPSREESQHSREELVAEQQKTAEEVSEIERELAAGKFGELAPRRAQEAAESIEQSGRSLATAEEDEQAIAEARAAAELLRELSAHLGRRHDPDFDDKLAGVEREATQLSQQQRELSETVRQGGGSSAEEDEQRQLARRGEALADLVDQLQADTIDQDWEIQRELTEQVSANSPRTAASEMKQAAARLDDGESRRAAQHGAVAAATLQRFAEGLRRVQEALGPAQLEQLTKAEAEAAGLLEDLKQASGRAEQQMTQTRSTQFGQSLQQLARGDSELAKAAADLAGGNLRLSKEEAEPADAVDPQVAQPPVTLAEGLRRVDQILQRRIQEAILSGALQQSDANVPPGYVDMVEEYYRTLSKDVE